MRIALGIAYDGSCFEGWQTQPHGRTVQDVLEGALVQFAQEPLPTICAGRTDAGVHASAQVVHVDTTRRREPGSWVRGVNRYLPPEIAVRWSCAVPEDFHARFGARARQYDYWIYNHPVRSPLLERRTAWCFRPLDVAAMRAAAACLLGTHDFSSFRSAQCQAAHPERSLYCCEIEPMGPALIRVRARANAFLHHMMRNIAGALVAVGTGREPVAWMGSLLQARDRRLAAPTLAPDGLYLTRVDYDAKYGLPAPEPAWEPPS